jgi:hypothetical protein
VTSLTGSCDLTHGLPSGCFRYQYEWLRRSPAAARERSCTVPALSSVRTGTEVRKQRVLTYSTPSNTGTSAPPVVIQDSDRFLLVNPDVGVPRRSGYGLGGHFQGCRNLPTYQITIKVVRQLPLGSSWAVVPKDKYQRDDGHFTDG